MHRPVNGARRWATIHRAGLHHPTALNPDAAAVAVLPVARHPHAAIYPGRRRRRLNAFGGAVVNVSALCFCGRGGENESGEQNEKGGKGFHGRFELSYATLFAKHVPAGQYREQLQ